MPVWTPLLKWLDDGAGQIHPEFPHLGPRQADPTTATPQDDMLLQVPIPLSRDCSLRER